MLEESERKEPGKNASLLREKRSINLDGNPVLNKTYGSAGRRKRCSLNKWKEISFSYSK